MSKELIENLESRAFCCREVTTAVHYYGEQKDALARDLEAAAKDVRRLDWLEENNARLQFEAEDESSLPHAVVYVPSGDDGGWDVAARGDDFREAIDAAMAK